MTKRFLLTLKSQIKVQQLRADKTPITLETNTLIVDWPMTMDLQDHSTTVPDAKKCGWVTVEAPLVNMTVVAFEAKGHPGFWQSPFLPSGSESFEIQLRRDLILSRQEVK